MIENIVKSRFFNLLSEILIPAMTWILITFPLWMSPFHPAIVAYFIISFDLYYFYKAITTTYYAVISYKTILNFARVSFNKKVKAIKSSQNILHFIIIPNFKEPLHKLEKTIDYVIKNDYPYKNIIMVLAFEEKEVETAKKEKFIRQKYQSFFKEIITSYHILKNNEEQGKASNQTYAAKIVDN